MASRRMPLAAVPNAVNSPVRAGAGAANAASKRARLHTEDVHDAIHTQPPAKRQMLELNQENIDPRAELGLTQVDDQFPKRSSNTQATALEKKLIASREKRRPTSSHPRPNANDTSAERQARYAAENLESVRQWQRHYRRQFPAFVFYLDGLSDDVRAACGRKIRALGAREEKFFSKTVTHVVTTRPVSQYTLQPSRSTATHNTKLLGADAGAQSLDQRKSTNVFDNALQKRADSQAPEQEARRLAPQTADVLTRASELGIKIWQLEKLERILRTMFEADTGEQGSLLDARNEPPTDITATRANTKQTGRTLKDVDLEQLLRNERIHGPADRDPAVTAQDMVTFKGCYIYIHDMDEKTRPVMIRDYPRPAHKTEGKWPQLRETSHGRCPFLEDQAQTKQQTQNPSNQQQAKAQREIASQRRTRGSGVTEDRSIQALGERSVNLRRSPRKTASINLEDAKPLEPPKLIPTARRTSQEDVPLFTHAPPISRPLPRMVGGMPVASGIQHSNVTSAIRSQIASSTAISSTAPGMSHRRVTDSKELTALKRKVLERGARVHSQQPSSYMNDMRAAINDESAPPPPPPPPPPRAAKRKAQESILGVVHEDADNSTAIKQRTIVKRRKPEKDAKPGYCENCRDKFDDFEEHINSRKHQKFARSAENFKELDALLAQLKRPHKAH